MKLLTLDTGGLGHPAVLVDEDTALDLTLAADTVPQARLVPGSVRGILAAGEDGLDAVRRTVDAAETDRDRLRETGALGPFADMRPSCPPFPIPT